MPRIAWSSPGVGDPHGRGRRRLAALAGVVTLVLGGASVARAVTAPALDAKTDLEFSLDGTSWTSVPDAVIGSWGCSNMSPPVGGVDPCAMAPGETISRTYYVRNSTTSAQTGKVSVGVGAYTVSSGGEFTVASTISGEAETAVGAKVLLGSGATNSTDLDPAAPDGTVASLALAPGKSARIVDVVAVPAATGNYSQRQSVSPLLWLSFEAASTVDSDGDGLTDDQERHLGTDPHRPDTDGDGLSDGVEVALGTNPLDANDPAPLPDGATGQLYPTTPLLSRLPAGASIAVDTATLPAGITVDEAGRLSGRPTAAGTYSVKVTVRLADGTTVTLVRKLVIRASALAGATGVTALGIAVLIGGFVGGLVALAVTYPGFWGSLVLAADDYGLVPVHPGIDGVGARSATVGTVSRSAIGDGVPPEQERGVVRSGQVGLTAPSGPNRGTPGPAWSASNSDVRGPTASAGADATLAVLVAATALGAGIVLLLVVVGHAPARRPRTPSFA